jgi:hypothetical protein
VEQFLTGVTGILDSREIGGGAMSTKRLQELLDEATKDDVHEQLSSLAENGPGSIQGNNNLQSGNYSTSAVCSAPLWMRFQDC